MGARTLNILFLEDHADPTAMLINAMRADGHLVVTASTAAEVRAACARQAFDLLICNLRLPTRAALELLQCARQSSPRAEGLVLSHYGDTHLREAARQAGFLAYLINPLDANLLQRLTNHLSRWAALTTATQAGPVREGLPQMNTDEHR